MEGSADLAFGQTMLTELGLIEPVERPTSRSPNGFVSNAGSWSTACENWSNFGTKSVESAGKPRARRTGFLDKWSSHDKNETISLMHCADCAL